MTERTSEVADAEDPPVAAWMDPILRADLVGTVALALVCLAAAVAPDAVTQIALLAVSGLLFLGGIGAFAVGFLRLAGRSRYEVVDLGGVFYLTGSAPRVVRRWFLGLWFAQIVVAAGSAAFIHPPFGLLAPVWGIGLNPLWVSRHGTFPHRDVTPRA